MHKVIDYYHEVSHTTHKYEYVYIQYKMCINRSFNPSQEIGSIFII